MFTIDQIKEAHSKVKSGADFPNYVQDLIRLGVRSYNSFVTDGHTVYQGFNGEEITSGAKYPAMDIADRADPGRFRHELKEHQQGKSTYPEFCRIAAETGVNNWIVDTQKLTCTYYDKSGNELLQEEIPG